LQDFTNDVSGIFWIFGNTVFKSRLYPFPLSYTDPRTRVSPTFAWFIQNSVNVGTAAQQANSRQQIQRNSNQTSLSSFQRTTISGVRLAPTNNKVIFKNKACHKRIRQHPARN
jgi:hypothetical protein